MMRASFSALGLALVSLSCSQVASPTSPSALRANSQSASLAKLASDATLSAQERQIGPAHPIEVPFKGQFDDGRVISFTPILFPGLWREQIEAEGTASHLGRFTLDINFTLDVFSGNILPPETATFTAANGDTLTTGLQPTPTHRSVSFSGSNATTLREGLVVSPMRTDAL